MTSITIGSIIYTKSLFESITYNSIKFNTIENQNGIFEISVLVNGLKALSENFTFSYHDHLSPKIFSVSPSYLNDSNSLIRLSGQNFGAIKSKLHISIGGQNCEAQTAADTSITCILNKLNLGQQNIKVKVDGINFYHDYIKYSILKTNFNLRRWKIFRVNCLCNWIPIIKNSRS